MCSGQQQPWPPQPEQRRPQHPYDAPPPPQPPMYAAPPQPEQSQYDEVVAVYGLDFTQRSWKATDMLAPNLAPAASEMVVQSLLSEILQLGNADGLVVNRDHPRKLA